MISGPAGKKRDWDRERSLYYPGARLIPTAKPGANDGLAPQILDVEGFIARVEPYFAEHGFFEKEIARRTEQFGHIAQVWSTYESRHNADDPEPFMRGINSIQLFYDGNRWWIVNILLAAGKRRGSNSRKVFVTRPRRSRKRLRLATLVDGRVSGSRQDQAPVDVGR